MKLRLLWVSHFLPYPPTGGVLQRGYGLLSNVARLADVHLLAMHQPRLFAQSAAQQGLTVDDAIDHLSAFCASVNLVPIPSEQTRFGRHIAATVAALSNRSYTEMWLRDPSFGRAVERTVRTLDPDVAHFDTISLAPYAVNCAGRAAISIGHHNVESHMMHRRAQRSRHWLLRRALLSESYRILDLERRCCPEAALNVVCSTLDAKRLRRLIGPASIFVAENGVLAPEWAPPKQCDDTPPSFSSPRVAFVGRMSAYTNRDAVIHLVRNIWPLLTASVPALQLDIVGHGAPDEVLEAAAGDPRLRVHGFVPEVTDVLPAGTIFLCTMRDGGGTKLKILDAMNRGYPVVATPVALEGIDAIDGVHAMVAQSPESVVDAVRLLANSPRARFEMASNAARLVHERYSFPSIAGRLLDRMQSLRA